MLELTTRDILLAQMAATIFAAEGVSTHQSAVLHAIRIFRELERQLQGDKEDE